MCVRQRRDAAVTAIVLLVLLVPWLLRAQDIERPMGGMVRIESHPQGAEVWQGDSLVGRTPVTLERAHAAGALVCWPTRDAWPPQCDTVQADALGADLGVVFFQFTDMRPYLAAPGKGAAALLETAFRMPPAEVTVPALAGIGAGIASVILKQQADDAYDRYLATGDRTQLDRARMHDVYAGIAFGALNLCAAWLVWLLFRGS